MAMIPACIFTYSADSLPLRECVRGAKIAGLLPVVIDDAKHPMGHAVWSWVESQGGLYFQSDFNRRGNLNGTECAAGIAKCLYEAMRLTHTAHAFKLDSDTIIQRVDSFQGISTGVCSTTMNRREAFGCCYSLTRDAARRVRDDLAAMNDPHGPEDVLIWRSIKRLSIRHKLHDFNPSGGAFSAVPKTFDPVDCTRFDVLTFGNPPADGWKDRALEITLAMRRLNDFNFALANSQK
jgi:hypothetical protein